MRDLFTITLLVILAVSPVIGQYPYKGGRPKATKSNLSILPIAAKSFYYGINYSQNNFLPSLEYAAKDAIKMDKFFTKNSLYLNKGNVLRLNEAVSKDLIILELAQLARNYENGTFKRLIIYFSGHGFEDPLDDKIYLMGNSIAFQDPQVTGIPLDKLLEISGWFTKNGVDVLFIIDACYSGKMFHLNNARATMEDGQLLLFLSSSHNQSSKEGAQWNNGHGVFTNSLLNGMSGEAEDLDFDQIINVKEIRRYSEDMVALETDRTQTPVFYAVDEYKYIAELDRAKNEEDARKRSIIHTTETPLDVFEDHSFGSGNSFQNNNYVAPSNYNQKQEIIPTDTSSFIIEIEKFRNQLIDDPFTLPSSKDLAAIQLKINHLLASNLHQFSIYHQLKQDSILVNGLSQIVNTSNRILLESNNSGKENVTKKLKILANYSMIIDPNIYNQLSTETKTEFRKDIVDAITSFDKIVNNYPENAVAYILKASCFLFLDEPGKAIVSLQKGIQHKPNYPNFYLAKGWAYAKKKDFSKAIRNLRIFEKRLLDIRQLITPSYNKKIDWLSTNQKLIIEEITRLNFGEWCLNSSFEETAPKPSFITPITQVVKPSIEEIEVVATNPVIIEDEDLIKTAESKETGDYTDNISEAIIVPVTELVYNRPSDEKSNRNRKEYDPYITPARVNDTIEDDLYYEPEEEYYRPPSSKVKNSTTDYSNEQTRILTISNNYQTDIRLKAQDVVIIKAKGTIKVGTKWLGDATPAGIDPTKFSYGLESYNIFPKQNHGVLAYRWGEKGEWQFYSADQSKNTFKVPKNKSGYLEFKINDKRQYNNKGHYKIEVIIKRL